ncbi:uncharacterized protein PADG_05779 [Paracoccidioides brasiliensis Pb18]|uniref:Uncharacterized protein n=1 Tax=Paracoccidioides brasiliensis (strain Pb18) TaxID=502780 RepID=C1GEU3_PARBD|nr:uncharacterized protein PADG_05779 [Paracoccidioides brasiliensis Pb18]EEH49700.2 hypothetical protein PADG_05779 [Paracoccidioides brasiliensis Pb18]
MARQHNKLAVSGIKRPLSVARGWDFLQRVIIISSTRPSQGSLLQVARNPPIEHFHESSREQSQHIENIGKNNTISHPPAERNFHTLSNVLRPFQKTATDRSRIV